MPACSLHLLALNPPTTPQSFLSSLRQSRTVIVASRPRYPVIHPDHLDKQSLTATPWDLLVLIQCPENANDPSIPASLQPSVKSEYRIATGVPSKLIARYDAHSTSLKHKPQPPLTGSLDALINNKNSAKPTSQNLEISPDLLAFMDRLSQEHTGPVTMLNLLHFQHPDGKKSYYQYGQAFVPVAGKRGGDAKLVGNVVRPRTAAQADSRGDWAARPEESWWNEISIVHYPSIRHFCDMLAGPDYQEINERHRIAALKDTFLLCTTEFDVEGGAAKL